MNFYDYKIYIQLNCLYILIRPLQPAPRSRCTILLETSFVFSQILPSPSFSKENYFDFITQIFLSVQDTFISVTIQYIFLYVASFIQCYICETIEVTCRSRLLMFIAIISPCQYSKIIYILLFMNICIVSRFSLCLIMILLIFIHVFQCTYTHIFNFYCIFCVIRFLCFLRDPVRHLSKEIVHIYTPIGSTCPQDFWLVYSDVIV